MTRLSESLRYSVAIRWVIGVAVLTSLVVGPSEAQEVSAALRDRVNLLLDRLSDGDDDRADAAEAALIKLGDRILILLPGADSADAEPIRERIERIRTAIKEGSNAESLLEASLVTIKGEGIRLSEVLRGLQSQSGNPITDLRAIYGQDATNPALDLELEKVPFLEALDQVLSQANLTAEYNTGDGTIGILAGGSMTDAYMPGMSTGNASKRYNGPFRVVLEEIAAQNDFRSGNRTSNARLSLVWEPRIKPMLLEIEASDMTIVDNLNNTLEPTVSEESSSVILRPETPIAELNLNMVSPVREATMLSSLKVQANVTVPASNTRFQFALDRSKSEQTKDEVTVELERIQVDGFVWKIDLVLNYEGNSEAFETYQQGLFNNAIWLQRPDGSRFEQNGGFNQIGLTGNSIALQYLFVDAPGKPSDYELILETPGAVTEIPLEFEFKDVPLP